MARRARTVEAQTPVDRTTISWTERGRALLAAGLMLTLGSLALGFPDLARVGAVLLLLPIVMRLAARRDLPRLRVSRAAQPVLATAGEPIVVHAQIRADARHRGTLLGEDSVPPTAGERARFVLSSLGPDQPVHLRYLVRPPRRGRYLIGPMRIASRDPFGVVTRSVTVPGRLELLITPRVHPLTADLAAGGAGSEGVRPAMTALHGEDDASIRAYRTGDDLRRVHWPATAHRGTLMMRHEGAPSVRRAVLVVDTIAPPAGVDREDSHGVAPPETARPQVHQGSTHVDDARPDAEWAIEMAATLAVHFTQEGYTLHLASPETMRAGTVHERLSGSDALRLLADCTTHDRPTRSERAEHLAQIRDVAASGGLLVVVTAAGEVDRLEEMLSLRPAGGTGMIIPVTPRPSTSPGVLDEMLGEARSAGWIAALGHRSSSPADVWARLLDGTGPAIRVADPPVR